MRSSRMCVKPQSSRACPNGRDQGTLPKKMRWRRRSSRSKESWTKNICASVGILCGDAVWMVEITLTNIVSYLEMPTSAVRHSDK